MEEVLISELVRQLLAGRGVHSDDDVAAFLSPDYDAHTHSPSLLHGIEIAVLRVLDAVSRGERIAVYADFDCDGIPGAAVLSDFFSKINYTNVEVYLPHRDREGYGFHTSAINELSKRDVKLIITVDVGTVAIDACAFARSIGIDVIVTDHHEIIGDVPEVVALLNPKIAPYPFPDLCGAAVAFKLVQATLEEGKKRNIDVFAAIPPGWEKWLLDLVAIATVADMVPLVGENRALAFWGLSVLRKSKRQGITALCNQLRIKKSELTETDIGFSIGPRINAASRMDEPDLAFKLLTTTDRNEAEKIALQLESLNASRKGVVSAIVKAIKKTVKERFSKDDQVVVLGNPEWKPALLGLAANSIMNERGGVVCLWGRDANGVLKGSCRSDGAISLADLFAASKDLFLECGGHAQSGGFSVSYDQVHELPKKLAAIAAILEQAPEKEEVPTHDAIVSLREISWPLLADVARLAPFGIGNPKPIFRISRTVITSVRRFGKDKNHVEVTLTAEEGGSSLRAFDFFKAPEHFTHVPQSGDRVHVLGTLERDSFRQPAQLALRIVDILPEV